MNCIEETKSALLAKHGKEKLEGFTEQQMNILDDAIVHANLSAEFESADEMGAAYVEIVGMIPALFSNLVEQSEALEKIRMFYNRKLSESFGEDAEPYCIAQNEILALKNSPAIHKLEFSDQEIESVGEYEDKGHKHHGLVLSIRSCTMPVHIDRHEIKVLAEAFGFTVSECDI